MGAVALAADAPMTATALARQPQPHHPPLDRAACYRARLAREARFDGQLLSAVTPTGIYCRSVRPALALGQVSPLLSLSPEGAAGLTWLGLTWLGLAWPGLAWLDLARQRPLPHPRQAFD